MVSFFVSCGQSRRHHYAGPFMFKWWWEILYVYPFNRNAHSSKNLMYLPTCIHPSPWFSWMISGVVASKLVLILSPRECSNRRSRSPIIFTELLFSILRQFSFYVVVLNRHTQYHSSIFWYYSAWTIQLNSNTEW